MFDGTLDKLCYHSAVCCCFRCRWVCPEPMPEWRHLCQQPWSLQLQVPHWLHRRSLRQGCGTNKPIVEVTLIHLSHTWSRTVVVTMTFRLWAASLHQAKVVCLMLCNYVQFMCIILGAAFPNQVVGCSLSCLLEIFDRLLSETLLVLSCIWQSLSLLLPTTTVTCSSTFSWEGCVCMCCNAVKWWYTAEGAMVCHWIHSSRSVLSKKQ